MQYAITKLQPFQAQNKETFVISQYHYLHFMKAFLSQDVNITEIEKKNH